MPRKALTSGFEPLTGSGSESGLELGLGSGLGLDLGSDWVCLGTNHVTELKHRSVQRVSVRARVRVRVRVRVRLQCTHIITDTTNMTCLQVPIEHFIAPISAKKRPSHSQLRSAHPSLKVPIETSSTSKDTFNVP